MGRSPCCSKEGLNRGAWTVLEDNLLSSYIKAHGEGKWRSLPHRAGIHSFPLFNYNSDGTNHHIYIYFNSQFNSKYMILQIKRCIYAGLKRCGKSCRLRWLNYLRPDIKRGNITHDEEELIIRLHTLLGNRYLSFNIIPSHH